MGSAFSYLCGDGSTPSAVFETEYGCIRGKTFDIGAGRSVNAFLGVPYAKPPVGELRFKEPMPPDQWNGIRNCTKQGPRPPQIDAHYFESWRLGASKSEDCLYLNVFAPNWTPLRHERQRRSVFVWIHGGCFAMSSAAEYGDSNICRTLCAKDVVLVTVEYRLGILGFAATGDSNCVPNLGLRDQAFALGWIHRNIAYFGGDPNSITLAGQSAGGASVDFLSLSPYSRDLFQKVIPMSGSACCHWALNDALHVRDVLRSHARVLGWTTPEGTDGEKNASLMAFLKTQPVSALELGLGGKPGFETNAGLDFDLTPVIDGDFLPEPILELRRKSPTKICMAGVTDLEMLSLAPKERSPFSERIDALLEKLITEEDHVNYEKLRNDAKELYIGEDASEEELRLAYYRMHSDTYFVNGVYSTAAEMLNAGHKVYLYNFEYFSKHSFGFAGWTMPFLAPTHCSDLSYLFGKGAFINLSFNLDKFNEADKKVLENYTTLFTNFAKYGDPNQGILHDLQPLEDSNKWRYISVGEEVTMKEGFHGRRAEFWRQLDQLPVFLDP